MFFIRVLQVHHFLALRAARVPAKHQDVHLSLPEAEKLYRSPVDIL
jgi:hypothetical protein